jgi:hypothetical protein
MIATQLERRNVMSAERETGAIAGDSPSAADIAERDELPLDESLTDLFDRLDREAFQRSLKQRDLRLLSIALRRR